MLKSKLNLHLYSLLLVITPFLLLQNYLQDAIGELSRLTISIFNFEIKMMLVLVAVVSIVLIYLIIKNLSPGRVFGVLFVGLLLFVGYNTSDFYFNHHFYDIQHNWHYFAYAIFSLLAWKYYFHQTHSAEKTILRTFLLALILSLCDEVIQVFISSRVFDLSDVAKDLWGCMIGQFVIHFILFDMKYLTFKKFWQRGIKNWIRNGLFLLTLELFFAWIFLNVSSILSNAIYVLPVILITFVVFFAVAFVFQLVGNLRYRKLTLGVIGCGFLIVFFTFLFSEPDLASKHKNLVVYKNIPILYFDVMIFPDGMVRPVDKKVAFNSRDKQKINSIGADIVILGTGSKGKGGKGYQDQVPVEMCYNHEKNKVYQLIKLPNEEACVLFNRLKQENKEVLMIMHNS
ncbi:VanZ family protein [uncultured Draconibacterium sp.]|uniref:VanZ family protein n=1 Tax=uncultured Draconibacterium sp. TaxID=1573823 RepID=UPI0032618639